MFFSFPVSSPQCLLLFFLLLLLLFSSSSVFFVFLSTSLCFFSIFFCRACVGQCPTLKRHIPLTVNAPDRTGRLGLGLGLELKVSRTVGAVRCGVLSDPFTVQDGHNGPAIGSGLLPVDGHVTDDINCLVIIIAKDDNNIAAVQFKIIF